jgi:hypothetical protein
VPKYGIVEQQQFESVNKSSAPDWRDGSNRSRSSTKPWRVASWVVKFDENGHDRMEHPDTGTEGSPGLRHSRGTQSLGCHWAAYRTRPQVAHTV